MSKKKSTKKAAKAAPAAPAKSGTMTKRDLINAVADSVAASGANVTKTQITQIITELFGAIKGEIVDGGKYTQPRFGTFEIRERSAREGRSPQDPTKKIKIPASKTVGLKVSKILKDSLNN
jgi:DNA-binding protein HU-beta